MNLKQSISWKITLPIGVILFIIGGDILRFLGFILVALGIVDLITYLVKKNKGNKTK